MQLDAEKIIDKLAMKIAYLEKQNAILEARLESALDEQKDPE